ncbi:isocitrate lyase/phosphoenolpyruvate mutase family protein [Nonomuraea angiospora]|uniref:isocitrate lyase/PEP mutase family protein n=1 Tax=Nonomuraea angiospora TaxID=46172 RepID=UPI00342A7A19
MTTDRASALRALHVPGDPVILPNVWDAASALAVREAGFPAVATSSAAVARVLGYEDGELTPVGEMMAAVARIAKVVDAPVTADIERGYGLKPAELVERLLATGAVGCNLEDSSAGELIDPGEQADFLAEVRAAAGQALVINARVDTYLLGPKTREAALERGRRYLAAGADCVYPIGLADEDEIRALVSELDAPVNVYVRRGGAEPARLAELGVGRISFGGGLYQAVHVYAQDLFAKVRAGRSPY